MGLFTDVAGFFTGEHQIKLANEINPQYTPYQTSPYAKAQLGTALNLFNGRMAGAANQEQNIASSQAGFLNNVGRNATDSAQALALGGLSQGQANQAYNQVGIQEQQNKYNLLNNLNAGYSAMTNEGDKVYQDMLQKYQMDVQAKTNLRNSAYTNIFGALNDLDSSAFLTGSSMTGDQSKGNDKTGQALQLASLFL